ncbi:golgi-specific brefeldin A-resistance guanine nucleotide exchange factor 1 [Cricetulus griseus]|uniref:Golgi-specific brefeldin A-resistance guanine nucleotide exchange factor 1 n=1 Tax=Cricetulus griseus TaxID=10029 RepID=A0A061IDW6_CRIGR|nr:golgi-specific brefeldin A-resistance guanine nucleotide exchange factor 1 [Cricetulus griseus]
MVDKNIYIIQGEINIVVGAIKRNARWSTHIPLDEERDPLLHSFSHLKEVLNSVTGSRYVALVDGMHYVDQASLALIDVYLLLSSEC